MLQLEPDNRDRRIAALTTLLDVALKLSSEQDEDRIFDVVTQGACSSVPCERTSLFVLDEGRQELYTRTATQLEVKEIRRSLELGIVGWVAREKQMTCVPDPAADARWDGSVDRQTGFLTRNILAVPVMSQSDGRMLGVLELINTQHAEFEPFDMQIAQAFAAHAATALERARFQREADRAAELRREMELARLIQRAFLPDHTPEVAGYDFAAWWQPAEFVSGDYYDWFPLSDRRLGIAVGDVCGHGMGPSLIMASLRAMLHVLAKTTSDPETIMALLAETIGNDLGGTQFVTFVIASLDPITHVLKYSNAGHGPAYHIRRRQGDAVRLDSTRLPLGFPDTEQTLFPVTVHFEPGDLLLLGTDGVIEARNAENELFGAQRLVSLVKSLPDRTAAELTAAVSEAVAAYQAGSRRTDDATLLIVKRLDDPNGE